MDDNSALFPVFLNLTGKRCLLMGGEGVAVQKLHALRSAGARVEVVAETLCPEMDAQRQSGRITWHRGPFTPSLLRETFLVVSTLEAEGDNAPIFTACEQAGIFVNVMDRPNFCTVVWPAVVSRGAVQVAITTSGESPAFAGWLRRRIEALLPQETEAFVAWLGQRRRQVAPLLPNLAARARFWRDLLEEGLAETYFAGKKNKAQKRIDKALEQARRGEGR